MAEKKDDIDIADIETLKALNDELALWNADQITEMIDILVKVKNNTIYTDKELVDLGFFLREMERQADEIRKECKAKKELIGRVLCLRIVRAVTEDPDLGLMVRGQYASGSADVAQAPGIPKFGTAEYKMLCEALGVSGIAKEEGLASFHFTRLGEHITRLAAEGKNPPPGIGKTYEIYRIIWRKKRGKK